MTCVLGWISLAALLGVILAVAAVDRWLFVVLDPGAFDPAATPAPPDYATPTAWAALPTTAGPTRGLRSGNVAAP
jgi:hypothetical protein